MRNKMPDTLMDEMAKKLVNKYSKIGYPVTQGAPLKGFYEWMIQTKACESMMDNVGDAFKPEDHIMPTFDVEREVIKFFAPLFGFDVKDAWGLVTNSGTDGNNHGIYFGNTILKKKGKPVMYVSKEAHYSNARLADLQGIELCFIDSDEEGHMSPKDFEKKLDASRPALVVFALGTTFKGAIDDGKVINEIIARKNPPAVYRHADAALFGGYLIFDKHGDIVLKDEYGYDSIAISGHKFFGVDEPCGVFLCPKSVLEKQKAFEVTYLNGNMPMISCSRSALSPLKLYWLINHYGISGYKAQTEKMLENAVYLKSRLDDIGVWAKLLPHSNTVYFSRPHTSIMHKYGLAPDFDERLGGALAHIVVMPHVSKEIIDEFISDFKNSLD